MFNNPNILFLHSNFLLFLLYFLMIMESATELTSIIWFYSSCTKYLDVEIKFICTIKILGNIYFKSKSKVFTQTSSRISNCACSCHFTTFDVDLIESILTLSAHGVGLHTIPGHQLYKGRDFLPGLVSWLNAISRQHRVSSLSHTKASDS